MTHLSTRIGFTALPALLVLGAVHAQGPSSFYLEGALVHHVVPEAKTSDFPVIMVPGLNLSSYIFLTTPDGRPGWVQQFAEAGHEVYVVNDPRFDFSRGFSVPGFQEVPKEGAPPADPKAQQGWQQDIWRRWGFGWSEGKPYPDAQFPAENFVQFEANYPYLSRSGSTYSQAITALLEKIGPAILIVHSAGCPQGLAAAKAHPSLVAGLVLVEPTGPPSGTDFPVLSGISMLGVYADYVDSRRQGGRKAGVEAAAELFNKNGGIGEVISLPEDHKVRGNSHLMMQDKNNAFISGLIIKWLGRHARTPPPGTTAGAGPEPGAPAAGGVRGRRGAAMRGGQESAGSRPGMQAPGRGARPRAMQPQVKDPE